MNQLTEISDKHSVNWTDWRDVKKVLQVFESILHTAEKVIQGAGTDSEFSKRLKAEMENMLYYLRKDGFQYVDGRIVSGMGMPSLDGIKDLP